MKIFNKKVVSAVVLSVLLFSLGKITYAFPQMDICNYTNGDKSGNYYDGLCTKDGKISEKVNKINYITQNKIENKEEKKLNHKLTPVKHYTGSSAFIGNLNSRNQEEINKLKEIISQQNVTIEKLKNDNKILIKNRIVLLNENKKLKNFINVFKDTFKNSNAQQKIDIETNNRNESISEKIKRINAQKAKNRKS